MPDSRSGAPNEKGPIEDGPFSIDGRRGGIRTRDPLHPMQVRYQAALHAEAFNYSVNFTSHREQVTDFLQLFVQV